MPLPGIHNLQDIFTHSIHEIVHGCMHVGLDLGFTERFTKNMEQCCRCKHIVRRIDFSEDNAFPYF